jgi:hypothetical protein
LFTKKVTALESLISVFSLQILSVVLLIGYVIAFKQTAGMSPSGTREGMTEMLISKGLAVQTHLASKGIAFANLKYTEPLLEELLKKGHITNAGGKELLGHKANNARAILRLLEHIGIAEKEVNKQSKKKGCKLTSKAKSLLTEKTTKNDKVTSLLPLFISWLPLRLFLKFVAETPDCTMIHIKQILGEQVKKATQEAAENQSTLGLKKGYLKPFNEMIILNALVRMSTYLGLLAAEKRKGPYNLTKKRKNISQKITFQSFFVLLFSFFRDRNIQKAAI